MSKAASPPPPSTPRRFSYYQRLSSAAKAVYRKSDEVAAVPIPDPRALDAPIDQIRLGLLAGDRRAIEAACQRAGDLLCDQLAMRRVRFSVLAKRPSRNWGELHGLYDPTAGPDRVLITLWMRTAQRREVVAFKTFLRTFLHEVGHHLDYEWLRLSESFHTQGFYRRESSLVRQLLPEVASPEENETAPPAPRTSRPDKPVAPARASPPYNLSLFPDASSS